MYAPQEARVWIPLLGGGGAPAHGFWIDPFLVTNEDFAAFVDATGWITTAERQDFGDGPAPSAPTGSASMVFRQGATSEENAQVWARVAGADWRHPSGPGGTLEGLWDHPVVHVSWRDAAAYANWVGAQLPTEVEWQAAAGAQVRVAAPSQRSGIAPVGSSPPNEHGLFDLVGNVWQWTRGVSALASAATSSACLPEPSATEEEGNSVALEVLMGSSFACWASRCRHGPAASRVPWPEHATSGAIGFRCVVRP